jgi:hypothetical protein
MYTLQAVLPSRRTIGERIETLLLLVTAAGRAMDADALQRAWFAALSAIEGSGEYPEMARNLLRLAQIGVEVHEPSRAHHAARRAFSIASDIGNHALKGQAAAILAIPKPERAA